MASARIAACRRRRRCRARCIRRRRPPSWVAALPPEASNGRLRDSGSLATSGPGPHRGDVGRGRERVSGESRPPKPVAEGHNSTLSPFLTCVALVYGPLLGFTVVVAWGHFSSAEANVAHEASTLTTMYRQTVFMPVPEQTQMRELLRKYAKTVLLHRRQTRFQSGRAPQLG